MNQKTRDFIATLSLFSSILLLGMVIFYNAAPKMQEGGDVVALDKFNAATYIMKNGLNTPDLARTQDAVIDLSGATIICATMIATGMAQAHIFYATEMVDATERAGWTTLQDGYIFMFDAGGGEVALGHWEDGQLREWEMYPSGHPSAPQVNLCAIVTGATCNYLRGLRRADG